MSDFDQDPYLDQQTKILRNRVGARTQVELDRAEADLSLARLAQLLDHPPRPTGDLVELRAIHGHLFQDVYEWAGHLRTVDIRKNTPGAQPFMPVSLIDRGAAFVAEELRADRMLKGMVRGRFVERLAHHYDQVNHLHPFREGNGRTQRVFWSRIALEAGWQLDWRRVTGAVNDHASRAAGEDGDLGPLRTMFDQITSPVPPAAQRDASWRAAEIGRQALAQRRGKDRGEGLDR